MAISKYANKRERNNYILQILDYGDTNTWEQYPCQRSYVDENNGLLVIPQIVLRNKINESIHIIRYSTQRINPKFGPPPSTIHQMMIENYVLSRCIAKELNLSQPLESSIEILYKNKYSYKIEYQNEEIESLLSILPKCRERLYELGQIGFLADLVFSNQLALYSVDPELTTMLPEHIKKVVRNLFDKSVEIGEQLEDEYY